MQDNPTRYRGVKYRNRLEAKWASFFRHLGWEAVYDPFADGAVTFLVQNAGGIYVKVTDAITLEDYQEYSDDFYDVARGLNGGRDLVVVGLTPLPYLANDDQAAIGWSAPRDVPFYWAAQHRDFWWSTRAAATAQFRQHEHVKSAWAKATNDIGATK